MNLHFVLASLICCLAASPASVQVLPPCVTALRVVLDQGGGDTSLAL